MSLNESQSGSFHSLCTCGCGGPRSRPACPPHQCPAPRCYGGWGISAIDPGSLFPSCGWTRARMSRSSSCSWSLRALPVMRNTNLCLWCMREVSGDWRLSASRCKMAGSQPVIICTLVSTVPGRATRGNSGTLHVMKLESLDIRWRWYKTNLNKFDNVGNSQLS